MIASRCRSFVFRSVATLVAGFCLFLTPALAQLQTVFSDYGTDATFLNRLNAAASSYTSLGATYFDATDAGLIQTAIQSDLQAIYSQFSINFVTTSPGGSFHTINFLGTDPSNFGLAPFDWRNQNAAETARVFPANFTSTNLTGSLLDTANSKALNRARFATALAGTAAHELGHTFGLDHQDAYGTRAMTNQAATGGVQNNHVMRTGSTGATATERAVRPKFNPLETAKLEVSGNLVVNSFAPVAEQGAAHGTTATAQAITTTALNYNNVKAAVVNSASIGAGGQLDKYRFTFGVNDLVSMAVINERPVTGPVDPIVTLYDMDGTTILRQNDDTRFGNGVGPLFTGNSFGQAGDFVYVNGSMVLNYLVTVPGDYYIEVSGAGGSTGNYELFVMAQAVPEPATIALIGVSFGGAGFIWYRRRQRLIREGEAKLRV